MLLQWDVRYSDASDDAFRFVHEQVSVHYNYFRDYDPRIGRYVESDPIGFRGGLNTYAYVEENPLAAIDPEGLQMVIPPGPVGGGAAGAAGAGNSGSGTGAIVRGFQKLWRELCESADRENQCNHQYYKVEIPTCRAIKRKRGDAPAAERCYASAMNRHAACLRGEPMPELDTRNN